MMLLALRADRNHRESSYLGNATTATMLSLTNTDGTTLLAAFGSSSPKLAMLALAVPEPATCGWAVLGLASFAVFRRRRDGR